LADEPFELPPRVVAAEEVEQVYAELGV